MLALLFKVGANRYGLDSAKIVEVVPKVELRQVPLAPAYIAGLCNYRERAVPVVDLCQLLQDQPCQEQLSTRIILVDYADGAGRQHILGLMAEGVTETEQLAADDFKASGIEVDEAPFLGGVALREGAGTVQLVAVEGLLPEAVQARLFNEL